MAPRLNHIEAGSKIDSRGEKQNAAGGIEDRDTVSGTYNNEDTSYNLIGSATVLEYFGGKPILAPQPDEAQCLASPRSPHNQQTPRHSRLGSQNMPLLHQPSKYFEIPSSKSSMPTPTFQDSHPDRFSTGVGPQHPNVQKRSVQRVLDDTVFRSSNIFPGSALGDVHSSGQGAS